MASDLEHIPKSSDGEKQADDGYQPATKIKTPGPPRVRSIWSVGQIKRKLHERRANYKAKYKDETASDKVARRTSASDLRLVTAGALRLHAFGWISHKGRFNISNIAMAVLLFCPGIAAIMMAGQPYKTSDDKGAKPNYKPASAANQHQDTAAKAAKQPDDDPPRWYAALERTDGGEDHRVMLSRTNSSAAYVSRTPCAFAVATSASI